MSSWRYADHEPCPLTDLPPGLDVCRACRFFRGAVHRSSDKAGWEVLCNWPRDGQYLADTTPSTIPAAFLDAFSQD